MDFQNCKRWVHFVEGFIFHLLLLSREGFIVSFLYQKMDECGDLAEFASSPIDLSLMNFSFKVCYLLACNASSFFFSSSVLVIGYNNSVVKLIWFSFFRL